MILGDGSIPYRLIKAMLLDYGTIAPYDCWCSACVTLTYPRPGALASSSDILIAICWNLLQSVQWVSLSKIGQILGIDRTHSERLNLQLATLQ